MANRRYLYFAQKADVEGQPDAAAIFRSTAEGETGHAFGHLEVCFAMCLGLYIWLICLSSQFLEEVGDPVTGEPIGSTEENLKSAIKGETHEYSDMYPGYAKTAREEGFEEVAAWFETLAMAEKSHANRFSVCAVLTALRRSGAHTRCWPFTEGAQGARQVRSL
jgi:rubrerythrin